MQVSGVGMFKNMLYLSLENHSLKSASGTGEGRGGLQLTTPHYQAIPGFHLLWDEWQKNSGRFI